MPSKIPCFALSFSLALPLPVLALESTLIGRYATHQFDESAAEIVAWHGASQRAFVVNANSGMVDVLDLSDLDGTALRNPLTASNLFKAYSIDLQAEFPDRQLGAANSVAVHGNLLAVAVEAKPKQFQGLVALYRISSNGQVLLQNSFEVGALPDMLTFSPDGRYLVVANEGEPADNYWSDPVGSVSIIHLPTAEVRTAGFEAFNAAPPPGVRVFGPGATLAQDLEPEYVAISADSQTARVVLQENNAIAFVNLPDATVTYLQPLGFKDHAEFPMDASNKDDGVNIQSWPGVVGMYQPDAITRFTVDGKDYYLTANEGDARDYWFDATDAEDCARKGGQKFDDEDGCLAFSEETRAGKLEVEAPLNAATVADPAQLGRLKVTTTLGDADGNGKYETLYAYGGRSFSVWSAAGVQLWDSGDELERLTADRLGDDFNASNDENGGDDRSDDKGPEPEAIITGQVNDTLYAFVGLERVGGFVIYDLTTPAAPGFVDYVVNRDFSTEDMSKAGDLGPEGMAFVPADESPTGAALLIIGNEVSGSTAVYQFK